MSIEIKRIIEEIADNLAFAVKAFPDLVSFAFFKLANGILFLGYVMLAIVDAFLITKGVDWKELDRIIKEYQQEG